ncbi:MAG: acyltransferase family protein [Gallionella sp.]|nr:acyltransferase family protein [Gallionella sp.]MDD4960283.1 acyltransferase family protein [Gallionella sp.]
MSQLKYRPDIDGLRAIAVVVVVLFHAGFSSLSGGFTGVDIFFVISGYLITGIIAKEIRLGTFSIISFYERRIRRILPAFFVVAVVSSIMAFYLMLPQDFAGYGKSLIASALSGSNILFWREAGYFNSSGELKPLLHTWSLGVEEQFYIFFPLFLLLLSRYSKSNWGVWIIPLALISFVASIWGVEHRPDATFYLAPTRAWELSLGALLALNVIPVIHRHYLRELIAFAGLVLIVFGVLTLTPSSSFPGMNALFPCLGAALIIHAGSNGQSVVGHLLSWRPFVLIGLTSYSLYLWHWPLLVFAKYYIVRPLTSVEASILVVIAFVAAVASWHFVERPFRKRKKIFTPRFVFLGGAFFTLVLIIFGIATVHTQGFPNRVPGAVKLLASGELDVSASSRACMDKNRQQAKKDEFCHIGSGDVKPNFVVLGDSHASALMPGFDFAAKKYGQAGVHAAMASCAPLDGVELQHYEEDLKCVEFRDKTLDYIEKTAEIESVVLVARWPVYSEGTRYGKDDSGPTLVLMDEKKQAFGNHEVFSTGLERTVSRLRRANKKIFILYSVPEIGWNVPSTSARNLLFGQNMDIRPKVADYIERNKYVKSVIERISSQYGARVIYPSTLLCGTESSCSIIIGGRSLYVDDDHLSVFGAQFISVLFAPIFNKAT